MIDPLFADCEGNNFLDDIDRMWTFQLADGVDGEITVYADQPGFPPLREGLKRMKEAEKVVFHNAFGFDFEAINKLYPGTLRREQIIDTLIISRLMDSTAQRHSLADLGEALGYKKLHFDDFSQFSMAMVKYGKRDVKILQEAWKGAKKVRSFGAFYETFQQACENEFHFAYCMEQQRQHGFRFLYEDAQMLEAELRQEKVEIERELQEIFPPVVTPRYSEKQIDKKTGKPKRLKDHVEVFNAGSNQIIEARLKEKYNWKPSKKTPTGQAKIDETILEELPYPEAKLIARYKKLGKKLGQVADGKNAWLKLAQEYTDGSFYIHGEMNTLGARTHRCSHFKPNMAQVDGDPRMRALFVANPNDFLIGVDAEGLELRELAHFLFPYDEGVYADIVHSGDKSKGTDIHTVNRKAAELFLRDSAKTTIYAHNYGCFDKKLGVIWLEDARTVLQALLAEDPDEAQKKVIKEVTGRVTLEEVQARLKKPGAPSTLGAVMRSKLESGILGLGQLIAKCKRMHNKRGALPGHDDRWIPSASDHSALNTLLQGNGSIVMKKAQIIFDDEMNRLQLIDKVGYCANVHDEFQLSVHPDLVTDTGKVDKAGKPIYTSVVADAGMDAIAKAGEVLGIRCPLVGAADIGKSWADTH